VPVRSSSGVRGGIRAVSFDLYIIVYVVLFCIHYKTCSYIILLILLLLCYKTNIRVSDPLNWSNV